MFPNPFPLLYTFFFQSRQFFFPSSYFAMFNSRELANAKSFPPAHLSSTEAHLSPWHLPSSYGSDRNGATSCTWRRDGRWDSQHALLSAFKTLSSETCNPSRLLPPPCRRHQILFLSRFQASSCSATHHCFARSRTDPWRSFGSFVWPCSISVDPGQQLERQRQASSTSALAST
jgi:hypothetical protein